MQVIPSISVTNGTPTTLIPLSIVMLTVLIKDAYEQFYRYLKDKEQNDRQIQVLQGRNFVYRNWESIRVGQIIKIRKNTSNDEPAYIPCDMLVIKTSDHENRAFVQTKSLDGQTNLKLRKSFLTNRQGRSVIQNQCYLKQFQIQYSQPNKYFGQFDGWAQYEGSKVPIDTGNLILRGCTIQNVHQVIGIAVYTGKDTKLVLNSVKFKPKKSKLMVQINKLVIEIFIYQVIVALVCSLFNNLLENSYGQMTKMIPMSNFWITTCTWWLLMTYFVPISLMVTMEMVKLFQGSSLFTDPQGYSKLYDFNTTANNTSVNQNLGQIRYVFTDKTGTLTKNNMVFKNLICGGILLGQSQESSQPNSIPESMRKSVNIHDKKLKAMKTNPKFQEALKVIYLCHEIYAESEAGVTKYNSSSPDEIALINFAKFQQRQFLGEHDRLIQIAEGSGSSKKIVKYQKLALLEFNSDRKRMSVIIRDPIDKSIHIYTKGADSTVQQLLRKNEKDLQVTQKYIDELSVKGLRTLLLAKRKLSDEEFKTWIKSYEAAKGIVGNSKAEAIIKCEAEVEKNMELVGATAIEDELQDEVCQTITDMRLAGMTFFILTGDKRETAINIGRSCGLVDPDAQLIDIPEYDPKDEHTWQLKIKKLNDIKDKKVFLLNASKIIPRILPSEQTICYRCTPANKKSIVKTFKKRFPTLTMAVGDGSNDVNMITAADVGIGVKGKQGTEAARVADFVVGQFKFIKLLTLYYGREWYRKNSILANYSFFKNWFHVSAVVAFGGYTYFSGVMIFNVYLYELFNVIFSSWPIIIWAVFDQQYTFSESSESPELYAPGINNAHFNQTVFLKNVGSAVLYGVISLLLTINTVEGYVLDSSGFIGNMPLSGSVLFGLIIIVINLYILLIATGVKPFILVISLASIAVYWLTQVIYAEVYINEQYANLNGQWKYACIFFNQIIIIFFFILVEFGHKKYKEFSYKLHKMQQAKQIETELFDFIINKK